MDALIAYFSDCVLEGVPEASAPFFRESQPMTRPNLSVVLPTHNGGRFIDQSIGSVVAQTYEDWELLVVDDASSCAGDASRRQCLPAKLARAAGLRSVRGSSGR